MFYSHCLLSRKGPLGTIWLAAYFFKRLKKDQVASTDISSSVEKIMLDEVPVVAYRVLGYLLLGVVRIYSKKVDYLFHDCRKVLIRINDFVVCKKVNTHREAMCAPFLSITLPEKFELDAFDLDIFEDASRANMKPHQEIIFEETGAWQNELNECFSLEKFHHEEASAAPDCSASYTPVEEELSPHMMDIDMMVSSSHNQNHLEASIEKLRGGQFSKEECLDFNMFCEAEEPHGPAIVGGEVDGNTAQMKFCEIKPSDDRKHPVLAGDHPESVSPDSSLAGLKLPSASGATTAELMIIPTPAKEEQARFSRKRRCSYDWTIVLPNEIIRQNIHDWSSLVCKRRKAPHTALDMWKTQSISRLPQVFLEPLIPCASELKSLFYKKQSTSDLGDAAKDESDVKGLQAGIVASKRKATYQEKSDKDLVLMSSNEGPMTPVSDTAGPMALIESIGQKPFPIETEEHGLNLMDEDMCPYGNTEKPYGLSARTRTVARYLQKSSRNEKNEIKEVNLSAVLESRTRRETARLFYEILVLRTGGFVDVNQENPYGEIVALITPRIEEIL